MEARGSRVTRYIPPGHAENCNCVICATMWLLSLKDWKALPKIRHFFKTKEMT